MRVAVLVSGRGSNLGALLEAFPPGHPDVCIAGVYSNRPHCAALDRARAAGLSWTVFPRDAFASRDAQQAAIAARVTEMACGLIVLAGYDQIVTATLLQPFAGRIINIHPSLLPAFAGTLHAQAAALAYGVKVTGCTVHYVSEAIDAGPIIAQAIVSVHDDDDEVSLSQRILIEEHRLLPEVVQMIAQGRVRIVGRRVRITEGAANASIAERP